MPGSTWKLQSDVLFQFYRVKIAGTPSDSKYLSLVNSKMNRPATGISKRGSTCTKDPSVASAVIPMHSGKMTGSISVWLILRGLAELCGCDPNGLRMNSFGKVCQSDATRLAWPYWPPQQWSCFRLWPTSVSTCSEWRRVLNVFKSSSHLVEQGGRLITTNHN
jgi:hypothetical protein